MFTTPFAADRRRALQTIGAAAGVGVLAPSLLAGTALAAPGQAIPAQATSAQATSAASTAVGGFSLPVLPYAYDALEPYVDAVTMHLHHDKHHQAYVTNLNAAVAAHPELAGKRIEELLTGLDRLPEAARTAVRNHGGGHYNHSFFWQTLGKPGTAPKGELAHAIAAQFNSVDGLKEKMVAASLRIFGSGWAWLVQQPNGALSIETTANQDCPLSGGVKPVLALDVWEHAYYLKYQNRRVDYAKAFFEVVNWEAVSAGFAVRG